MTEQLPKKVSLRNGQVVEFRALQEGDTSSLFEFFNNLPTSSTEFLKHDVKDRNVIQQFVDNRDDDTVSCVLALLDDRIVADATLHCTQFGWRRHIGEVRVVVDPSFQKQRLATKLIHELVNQASVKSLRKLEAQILANQHDARKAFEQLGFREEARLQNHAQDLEGDLHDLVIMTNTVDDLWHKMEDMITDLDHAPDGY